MSDRRIPLESGQPANVQLKPQLLRCRSRRSQSAGMLAAAFVALITSQMASQSKAGVVVPKIEVDLDEGQPAIANLSIDAPLEPFSLSLTNTAELRFATEPRCSHGILEHRSARTWAAPADCGRVTWSAAIPAIDQTLDWIKRIRNIAASVQFQSTKANELAFGRR